MLKLKTHSGFHDLFLNYNMSGVNQLESLLLLQIVSYILINVADILMHIEIYNMDLLHIIAIGKISLCLVLYDKEV